MGARWPFKPEARVRFPLGLCGAMGSYPLSIVAQQLEKSDRTRSDWRMKI